MTYLNQTKNEKTETDTLSDSHNRPVGRPRALDSAALERVLSLHRSGLGTRAISTELRGTGIDVSRPTVQRELKRLHAEGLARGCQCSIPL